jgi:NAD(P)-dependent dehydrogenase (short-subunit alcohol dehydrogenase family)
VEDLTERVAVVTGAGSGIGRATASALARAGAAVVAVDLRADRADATAAAIVAEGGRATGVAADVAVDGSLEPVRELAMERYGRIDVVFNNVGVLASGLPLDIPIEEWRRILETNVLSIVRSNAVFLPGLIAQGTGHVVNTASTAGLYPYAYDRMPYSTAKAAVVSLSESMALWLKPLGIGVSCLCPGPVRTNIIEQNRVSGPGLGFRAPKLALLDAEVVADLVVDGIRRDRFLVLTHPEVHDTLVARADDPDGFLAAQIADLAGPGLSAPG